MTPDIKIGYNLKKLRFLLFALACQIICLAQHKPSLLLSPSAAVEVKKGIDDLPVLKKSFEKLKHTADIALSNKIDVPTPVDNGGGYTHEKHKQNYRDMYAAGTVYAIGGDKKYAVFVEDMLLAYAKMYPALPIHPQSRKDKFSGKLFWQSLNDCVWLVNSIQAYDMVKGSINPKNQKIIERDAFRKMSDFLSKSEGSIEIFNWNHNHGTWAMAAVGMTGYVLHDQDMVDRSLYGSAKDKKSGFFCQLDALFSPDGYYSEGPYYQRYALHPFMVFAAAIDHNQPELRIFKYRDGLLGKATRTMFALTDQKGLILPFNDALKEKDIHSEELVIAADIAYQKYQDESLLGIIKLQDEVSVADAGLSAAKALPFQKPLQPKTSQLIADGIEGKSGGIALLNSVEGQGRLSLIFKYASQGMNHGHFDRLGIQLYDGVDEILQDYGAVRFINIEAKNGGRYIKENETYAKQSVAHNTVIVDETSHFRGNWEEGQKTSPQLIFADISSPADIQIVSAREVNAYTGISMRRTVAMIGGEAPFLIDVYSLASATKHRYDLNFMYTGQVIETDFKYGQELAALTTVGIKSGYEHLWKIAQGNGNKEVSKFTWLKNETFYTISTITDTATQLLFTKVGAHDPDFNLRNESGYMVRVNDKDNYTFASVIEPHGNFDAVPERVTDSHSKVSTIKLLRSDRDYTIVFVGFLNGQTYTLLFANEPGDKEILHRIELAGKNYKWKGNYQLIRN